ncbi:MAG: hypothetical protein K8M05_22500, partial [Deltaproteobacteria bacterium]|nr:hypothetical protein [Kofleriaceae bacterium]
MSFVFATGWEREIKDDVARDRPDLRLAFSRPGVVTFKTDVEVAPDVARPSPWAHVWGASIGRTENPEEALAMLPADARRLHVYVRDASAEGTRQRVD